MPLNPIANNPLPDPYVYRDGSDWYIFGTANYMLQGKSLTPDSLRKVNIQFDFSPSQPAQIWSMTVYRHTDGTYHAYATLHYGNFRTVVGHFVPQAGQNWTDGKPITKWKLKKILVGDMAAEDWVYYESKVLTDEDGTMYLMFTGTINGANHIMVHRMLDPDTLDPAYTRRTILKPEGYRSEDRDPGGMQLVEAGGIHKVQGKYILFYTVGNFTADNYKIGVAFSDTMIPPPGQTYQKVLIPDPNNLWGSSKGGKEIKYVLQSQIKEWPNYCRDLVAAPGVGSLLNYEGTQMLVFHGYLPTDTTRDPFYRYDWMIPIKIDISADKPMEEWVTPVLSYDKVMRIAGPEDVMRP